MGCVVCGGEDLAVGLGVEARVYKKMRYVSRQKVLRAISSGEIRKALLSGFYPEYYRHGVMILAHCEGAGSIKSFPWRRRTRDGKVYMVDFLHKWDEHNGRPGRLARNDEARSRRYEEMGFSQIRVEDARQLPFL